MGSILQFCYIDVAYYSIMFDYCVSIFSCTLLYSQTIFLLPGMMKARLEKLTSDSHRSTIPIRIQKDGYVPPLEWASLDFVLVASSFVPNV